MAAEERPETKAQKLRVLNFGGKSDIRKETDPPAFMVQSKEKRKKLLTGRKYGDQKPKYNERY